MLAEAKRRQARAASRANAFVEDLVASAAATAATAATPSPGAPAGLLDKGTAALETLCRVRGHLRPGGGQDDDGDDGPAAPSTFAMVWEPALRAFCGALPRAERAGLYAAWGDESQWARDEAAVALALARPAAWDAAMRGVLGALGGVLAHALVEGTGPGGGGGVRGHGEGESDECDDEMD